MVQTYYFFANTVILCSGRLHGSKMVADIFFVINEAELLFITQRADQSLATNKADIFFA